MLSKLTRGNAYILKERDNRNVVTDLYVLDPDRCRPMVAVDGSIFYEVQPDRLAGIAERVFIPAREIIHDRMNAGMFDPLCGVSPLFAAGLAATHGLNIQNQSARFFANNAQPSIILTTDPSARITEPEAIRMQEQWKANFGGDKIGNVAVLAGGLKVLQLSMTAVDAQLIDQLKLSAEQVCGVFHVPPYKVNVGAPPLNNNVQSLNVEYYSQCLQKHFEDIELCLDEGLGIGEGAGTPPYLGTEFDLDNLLRMDTEGQMRALKDSTETLTPDERRARVGVRRLPLGGNTVYLQQQNYSVEALAKRDALPNPFDPAPKPEPSQAPLAQPLPAAKGIDDAAERRPRLSAARFRRRLAEYDAPHAA
jgi:HK97 family phage portal protein